MYNDIYWFIGTDGVILNQAQGMGSTMKRGDMHEELGYIPPPNRKLPPVPGSQYNTCDRIKRGKSSLISSILPLWLCFQISFNFSH